MILTDVSLVIRTAVSWVIRAGANLPALTSVRVEVSLRPNSLDLHSRRLWGHAKLDACEALAIADDFQKAGIEKIKDGIYGVIGRHVWKLGENRLSEFRSVKPHDDVALDHLRADEVDDFEVIAAFARFLRFGSEAFCQWGLLSLSMCKGGS